ncbi:ABC transporter substrate-binding protein [uncultured Sphingomonas sp.]|uniref:ABC transporter substrate-binding protein n=1 Tax=uncultured Sphingomonas sp. TaxID=158754 RepID=UPI0035CAB111
MTDTGKGALGLPSRLLIDAVAQGLVRFDAAGQIEPGLAERWIVTDGGMSYIFRLREARWADGTSVTAEQVADRLQRQLAPGARNPLAPFLTAVDQVVAMTPQVVEVQLKRPRPDLLKLFAQPELALLRRGSGSGPLELREDARTLLLRPLPDPDSPQVVGPEDQVRLTGERAALAVARFAAGQTDLVAGGSFADWPLAVRAQLAAGALRIDPAAGLFGLSIVSRDGFLADPANRAAVAQAFDRGAITAAVPGWPATERLLPEQLDSVAPPVSPAWAALPLDQRRAAARAQVAAWGRPVTLRLALPAGPGATELWGQLAGVLRGLGVMPVRVPIAVPADLRLLDAVAPYDSARWYLASACQPCGAAALAAVLAARDASSVAERAQRIAEADAAVAADTPFIPLARPLRWSLVAPRLKAWQPNTRAWHPLNRLRADPT